VSLLEAANSARDLAYQSAIGSGLSDQEANTAARTAERKVLTRSQTLRISDNWALTQVKLGIPVKHWLVDQTLNAITAGYSYSQDFERSPIYDE